MQCERLVNLTKTWYLKVCDETMAPARMISFMERHAVACSTCLQDAELKGEIAKIKELILPESKIPKAVLAQQQKEAYEASLEDDEEYEDDIDGEDLT